MEAVKFVVKLYDLPSDDGAITAFDSFGPHIFVGTDRGTVMKFIVEDDTVNGGKKPKGGGGYSAASDRSEADAIFTTHVKTITLSELVVKRSRVAKLQHSRSDPLLFALCAKKLIVLDSKRLTTLKIITEGIGSFHISTIAPPSLSTAGGDSAAAASAPQRHVVCTAEKHGTGLRVYDLQLDSSPPPAASAVSVANDSVSSAASTSSPSPSIHVALTQELVLPEPVGAVCEANGMLCVGLRREYSMLSLGDGDARSILALNNRPPLMTLGDGEVFLRLQQNVFTVSMKCLPTAGQSVRRTLHFESEPQCMIFRHPFLFAFCANHCDVFSLYDDEVVERLQSVPGVLFAGKFGGGDTIYAASASKLWMMRIHPLRAQLSDLMERYKVADAFHLLGCQRRSSSQFTMIERELNIMAGFAHLYHGKASEAMHHFAGYVDIREILRHVPDICPLHIQHVLQKASPEGPESTMSADICRITEKLRSRGATTAEGAAGKSDGGCGEVWSVDEEKLYWDGWFACSPHNRIGMFGVPASFTAYSPLVGKRRDAIKAVPGCTIEEIWRQCFFQFPKVDVLQSGGQVPGAKGKGKQHQRNPFPAAVDPDAAEITRFIPETGRRLTESDFLHICETELKREVGCYARSTLATSSRDQRRASELAMLLLALQSHHFSSAYQLVNVSDVLYPPDVYEMLFRACEFRLLGLLLWRRGLQDEARAIFTSFVDLGSYVVLPCAKHTPTPESSLVAELASSPLAALMQVFEVHDALVACDPRDVEVNDELQWENSWSEIFVAVDHLDPVHIEGVLRTTPLAAQFMDVKGNTPLMIALSLLHTAPSMEPVLSVASQLIVDGGASILHRNAAGLSAMDIIAPLPCASVVCAFLSSVCTLRLRTCQFTSRTWQEIASQEMRPLNGVDGEWHCTHGVWGGFVVNREILRSADAPGSIPSISSSSSAAS